jgi:hypothetical protein
MRQYFTFTIDALEQNGSSQYDLQWLDFSQDSFPSFHTFCLQVHEQVQSLAGGSIPNTIDSVVLSELAWRVHLLQHIQQRINVERLESAIS